MSATSWPGSHSGKQTRTCAALFSPFFPAYLSASAIFHAEGFAPAICHILARVAFWKSNPTPVGLLFSLVPTTWTMIKASINSHRRIPQHDVLCLLLDLDC
jgi:hypothetical protein